MTKTCPKNDVYILVSSDLDLLTFRPQICSPNYSSVQCYVSTKLEVTKAFLFQENRMHRTDGRTYERTDGTGCNT